MVAKPNEGIDEAEQFVILIIDEGYEQLGSRSEDQRRAGPQSACVLAVSAASRGEREAWCDLVSKGTRRRATGEPRRHRADVGRLPGT